MIAEVEVIVPGDKSITHRALLFAALADGTSRIRGALDSADTRATASVLRALGADVPALLSDDFTVRGCGIRGLRQPAADLDCANSGTTARLMMGVLAGLPIEAVLTGDDSLRSRPMRRVTAPLSTMGATFFELGEADRLPIRVRGGKLCDIMYHNAQSSAQVKSALLLAALTGDAGVTVREPRLSRDHTERMLGAMGVDVRQRVEDEMHVATIDGASRMNPLDITVPRDFSSAAFIIARAVLSDHLRVCLPGVGINPGRTGMLDVLCRMNANVDVQSRGSEANEPVGTLIAGPARLAAATITADEIPGLIDEIPVLAILAARAEGVTRITGAGELRVKETDRIHAIAGNLRAIGVDAEELPDGMVITGTRAPLRGDVRTWGDHRIAMAFGVLAALDDSDIRIDDAAAVNVSYPAFWEELSRIREVHAR